MKQRIVILGDSLGMPRPEVKLEETYPYLLQKILPEYEVYAKHRRANDSTLQSEPQCIYDDMKMMNADIFVLHLGIVDCAPRLFTRREQRYLSYLKGNRFIISFMSKRRNFFTKLFPKVYVNRKQFKANMRRLIETGKKNSEHVIVVNIMDTSEENKQRSYNYEKNIVDYNSILFDLAKEYEIDLIDMFKDADESMLLDDGHHINANGNKFLTANLEELCRND